MKWQAVIFDLDGTLLDTIDDLTDSMNAALSDLHLPPRTVEECKVLVGDGREQYARRALGDAGEAPGTVARCVELMTEHYSRNWANKTRPYDGIVALLDALVAEGLPLAVLSNKYEPSVREAVGHFFDGRFAVVRGARDGTPHKPDPTSALQVAAELAARPEAVLYVGDTNTDMRTAVAAGMYPVGAAWGFRPEKELRDNGAATVISRPLELLKLLDAR
jgi:phosphoglycolate phosphatase